MEGKKMCIIFEKKLITSLLDGRKIKYVPKITKIPLSFVMSGWGVSCFFVRLFQKLPYFCGR